MPVSTLRAAALRPLSEHLSTRGATLTPVLASFACQPVWLEDDTVTLPTLVSDRIWEAAAHQLDDPHLALNVAQSLRADSLGLLTYLLAHSATWGDALQRLIRHYALVSSGVTYQLEPRAGQVWLHAHVQRSGAPQRQASEFCLAAVDGFARRYVEGWHVTAVRMRVPRPSDGGAAHARLFGVPVEFEATEHALVFDAAMLHARLRDADPRLLDVLERHADVAAPPAGEDDLLVRAQVSIAAALNGSERPSLPRVARSLGVGERSLRRRLSEQRTSFSALVDDARRQVAESLLSHRSTPLTEVARAAGFSHPRALNRAFQRWNRITLEAYRRSL